MVTNHAHHCPCCACRYGGAAAVWDIWRRQDTQPLQAWLVEHQGEFVHQGRPVEGKSQPLLDQVRCADVTAGDAWVYHISMG